MQLVQKTPWFVAGALVMALAATPNPATAQPFGAWFVLPSSAPATSAFVEIPHSPALNPKNGFTFEAWVSVRAEASGQCRSIAGKNWLQAWWVGVCNVSGVQTLRSYLKGSPSGRDGGVLSTGWQHIAVVYDKALGRRFHYINGLKVGDFPETGVLTTSTSPMRIASDAAYEFTPDGAIDEVRLWNKARTQEQLRANLNRRILPPKPAGLIGRWALDGSGNDAFGVRNGTIQGSGSGFLTFPAGLHCNSGPASGSTACLIDRFSVSATVRNPSTGAVTSGSVGATNSTSANPGAATFWFFTDDNWQLLVRALDQCSVNNNFWIFSSALTDQHFEISVFDTEDFSMKRYFYYPGAAPTPINDTNAFATCP